MNRRLSLVEHPMLSTRCRLHDASLWFASARLYRHHIELTGWHWNGRIRRVISLEDLAQVIWWTGDTACNLELQLQNEERIGLWIRNAGWWKYLLDRDARVGAAPPLPMAYAPARAA
jgi:hypothetical protein